MFSFSTMRCPRCMKAGEFTILPLEGGMTTCMGCITPNDVDGNPHDHDGNETTYVAKCERCGDIDISVNEHRIEVRYDEKETTKYERRQWGEVFTLPPPVICWCGWPHIEPELQKFEGPFMVGEVEGISIANTRALKRDLGDLPKNVEVTCQICDKPFVTSEGSSGMCPSCGARPTPELVK